MVTLSQVDLFNLLFIALYFAVCTGFVIWSIRRELKDTAEVIEHHTQILNGEIAERKAFLQELAVRALCLADPEELLQVRTEIDQIQKDLTIEREKIEEVERKAEAVKERIAELEQLDLALQKAAQENSLEVERLEKEQERVFSLLLALREGLNDVCDRVTIPFNEQISLGNELKPILERIEWFAKESGDTGRRYLILKRAYDALNIEYTQLYEKHSAGE